MWRELDTVAHAARTHGRKVRCGRSMHKDRGRGADSGY